MVAVTSVAQARSVPASDQHGPRRPAPVDVGVVAACVRSSIAAEIGTSTTSALLTSAGSTPAWTSVQPKLVEQRPDGRHVLVVADAL